MTDSIVYFIQAGEFVKIGTTTNLKSRLISIKTHSPFAPKVLCAIPGDTSREFAIHSRFEKSRANGEWFMDSPELRAFIASLDDVSKEILKPAPSLASTPARPKSLIAEAVASERAASIADPTERLHVTLDDLLGPGDTQERRLMHFAVRPNSKKIEVDWEAREFTSKEQHASTWLKIYTVGILSTVHESGIAFDRIRLRAFISENNQSPDTGVYCTVFSKSVLDAMTWKTSGFIRIFVFADIILKGKEQVERFEARYLSDWD